MVKDYYLKPKLLRDREHERKELLDLLSVVAVQDIERAIRVEVWRVMSLGWLVQEEEAGNGSLVVEEPLVEGE